MIVQFLHALRGCIQSRWQTLASGSQDYEKADQSAWEELPRSGQHDVWSYI
jgi:hypothetical protein